MDEPVHGILGRDAELAEVEVLGRVGGWRPAALLLEGAAEIGKTTMGLRGSPAKLKAPTRRRSVSMVA